MLATVFALVACGTIRSMRPTVLIVDDHAAFRASAWTLLQAEGFDVIGEATDGQKPWRRSSRCGRRSSCSTFSCPILTASRWAEQLVAVPDPPAVVLISSRDATAYGPRLQATPARGFIPKRGLSGEALAALVG
jgi:DNA-binding NarL/FixJ family response regulator